MNPDKNMIIYKSDVGSLLASAAKTRRTYAPIKSVGGDVFLEEISEGSGNLERLTLENSDMVVSHKDIFFPQSEKMFEYTETEITPADPQGGRLIFGLHSCDLQAMLFTDGFFNRDRTDAYYAARSRDRFIISIGCTKPPRPEACFCTSVGSGPFSEKGFDLQFVDHGDCFLAEIGTPAGVQFIEQYAKFFRPAQSEHINSNDTIKNAAAQAVTLKVDFSKALELMAKDDFIPQEIYNEIAEKCIYCGGCVYVCPTCTCFNVYDNGSRSAGERIRNWDACLFSGYTREASGHNPRKEKWIRTARRYEHKLKYERNAFATGGCVGCGRCLAKCPVNLGMSQFIRKITEE